MVEILEQIDGHSIIKGFDVCPVDPEATKAAIAEQIRQNPALADTNPETFFETYAIYSTNFGPDEGSLQRPNIPRIKHSSRNLRKTNS
jgi:hypothetical protein